MAPERAAETNATRDTFELLAALSRGEPILGRYLVEDLRPAALFTDESRGNPLFRARATTRPFDRVAVKLDLVPQGRPGEPPGERLARAPDEAPLVRAANLLGRLDHPGVVRRIEAGLHADRAVLVTEWIDGRTLRWATPHLSRSDRFEVALQLTAACEHVHAAGMLHRDLKPDNVLVGRLAGAWRAVLIDFDTALGHIGEERPPSGTLGFASPEQLIEPARCLDRRADIYSLGATLAHLFTGAPPFGDRSTSAYRQCFDPRPPPLRGLGADADHPGDRALGELLSAMLARDRAERPSSMGEVAERLRHASRMVALPRRLQLAPPSPLAGPKPETDRTARVVRRFASAPPAAHDAGADDDPIPQAEGALAAGRLTRALEWVERALADASTARRGRACLVAARVELFARRLDEAQAWAQRAAEELEGELATEARLLVVRCLMLRGEQAEARRALDRLQPHGEHVSEPTALEAMALEVGLRRMSRALDWCAGGEVQGRLAALVASLAAQLRSDEHRRMRPEARLVDDPAAWRTLGLAAHLVEPRRAELCALSRARLAHLDDGAARCLALLEHAAAARPFVAAFVDALADGGLPPSDLPAARELPLVDLLLGDAEVAAGYLEALLIDRLGGAALARQRLTAACLPPSPRSVAVGADGWAAIAKARLALVQEDAAAALDALEGATWPGPQRLAALVTRSLALARLGRRGEAVEAALRLSEGAADPSDRELRAWQCRCLVAAGAEREAGLIALRAARAGIDPNLMVPLVYGLAANGRLQDAVSCAEAARAAVGDGPARVALARALARVVRDEGTAREERLRAADALATIGALPLALPGLEQLVAGEAPGDHAPALVDHLATAYQQAGRADDAIAIARAQLAAGPREAARVALLARQMLLAGRAADAALLPLAAREEAQVALALADPARARRAALAALAHEPDDLIARIVLGAASLALGDADGALAAARVVLTREPTLEAFVIACDAAELTERGALADLVEAGLVHYPRSAALRRHAARVALRDGAEDIARREAAQAITLEPRHPAGWELMAEVLAPRASPFDLLALHRAWRDLAGPLERDAIDHHDGVDEIDQIEPMLRQQIHLALGDVAAAIEVGLACKRSAVIAVGLARAFLAHGDAPNAAMAAALVEARGGPGHARWMAAATLAEPSALTWLEAAMLAAPHDPEPRLLDAFLRFVRGDRVAGPETIAQPSEWLVLALRQLDATRPRAFEARLTQSPGETPTALALLWVQHAAYVLDPAEGLRRARLACAHDDATALATWCGALAVLAEEPLPATSEHDAAIARVLVSVSRYARHRQTLANQEAVT